jgi:hypothetical protein
MPSRWGLDALIDTLPTACAVGYEYFVGFANSLTINRFTGPQFQFVIEVSLKLMEGAVGINNKSYRIAQQLQRDFRSGAV